MFHFLFKDKNVVNKCLLIGNFIKRYQTSDFSNQLMTARLFCK